MIKFIEVVFILVALATTVFGIAVVAQKLSDKWHEYSMKREFDKMVEKEQRRYRRR